MCTFQQGCTHTYTFARITQIFHKRRKLGNNDLQMPATPLAVWRAIKAAKSAVAAE